MNDPASEPIPVTPLKPTQRWIFSGIAGLVLFALASTLWIITVWTRDTGYQFGILVGFITISGAFSLMLDARLRKDIIDGKV
jgi:hypothetical protein